MTTLPPHDDVVLRSLLEHNAATSPDAPFVAFEDGTRWTHRQALDETYAAANQLARHGIGQGDRVGIFLPNGPDFLRAWWGANALGAIIVPINLAHRGGILAHLLTLAQPTVVITDRDLAALLDEGGQAVASLDPAELRGSDTTPPCLDTGQHLWDPAAYSLTSGTTGPSKLSITTYHQLYLSGNDFIRSWNGNSDDVCLVDLPLFHLAGLFLITGSAVVGAQIAVRTAPA